MNDHTVVLAHGIARFDFLVNRAGGLLRHFGLDSGIADNELNYFKGIARHLTNAGINTYQSSVSFAADVETRARELRDEVETALQLRPDQSKVHIIAHSMGGLDARHMILNHSMEEKIASLTTIGTPHHGTSFADWGIEHRGDVVVAGLREIIDMDGFLDLTTASCKTFNQAARAAETRNAVFYQTVSACQDKHQVFAPLQPSWQIISEREGENDGLVSVTSQRWDEKLFDGNGKEKDVPHIQFSVPADHLNECGWWHLQQFRLRDLLKGSLVRPSIYEEKIRNEYLKIARKLLER